MNPVRSLLPTLPKLGKGRWWWRGRLGWWRGRLGWWRGRLRWWRVRNGREGRGPPRPRTRGSASLPTKSFELFGLRAGVPAAGGPSSTLAVCDENARPTWKSALPSSAARAHWQEEMRRHGVRAVLSTQKKGGKTRSLGTSLLRWLAWTAFTASFSLPQEGYNGSIGRKCQQVIHYSRSHVYGPESADRLKIDPLGRNCL